MIDLTREQPLSVAAVAKKFGVTERCVRGWVNSGHLEAVRLGGRIFTSLEAVQRFSRPAGTTPSEPRLSASHNAAVEQLRSIHGVG